MEMEDHHPQQYAITDLRQLAHFPSIPPQPTAELFPGHPNLTTAAHHHQHYEMMMFGRQVADIMPRCLHEFSSADAAAADAANTSIAVATTPTTTSASTPPLSGLGADAAGCIGGDASAGRWPRQETLTLLEIRSRLDLKFKEANQKGPLWDEVSRIMCEEHGYQRSGKKCREKFENLYKYYKKTKEGKAGRQDGKHYRFFRQLEALYGGDNNNNNNNTGSAPETTNFGSSSQNRYNNHQETMLQSHKQCDSLSLTNSTEFETSSNSDHHSTENCGEKARRNNFKRGWKVKIKEFIDLQMRKLVEKQEEWLDKLMRTLEQKEKERALREEEWRAQEAERLEREHKFWAKERAWIEARDAALMEALQKLTGNNTPHQVIKPQSPPHEIQNSTRARGGGESWQQDQLGNSKKRKENSRTCFYFENNNNNNGQSSSLYNNHGSAGYCDINDQEVTGRMQRTNDGSSPSNSNVASAVHGDTSCFPFFMSEGGNLWDNYSVKVNKANQNH